MIKLLLLMFTLSCISNPKPDFDPTLIGGTPADPKEFPASIYISAGSGRCTASVVGPQVVLSAAHCMGQGATITFTSGGNRYSAVCTHSRAYSGNSTADYAYCKTDKVVSGIKYEHVMIDKHPNMNVGSEIQLTGFGCVRPGGGGGNDGIYRIGKAKITRLPSGTDNDTIAARQPAALCFGDSGGPAFFYEGNKRFQLSVNSRGNISDTSYLSSMFSAEGKRFTLAWLEANPGMQICGVTPGTPNCRNEDEPKPEPKPGLPCKEAILAFDDAKKKVNQAYEGMLKCAQQ